MQNLLCNTYQTNYLKTSYYEKKFTIFNDYSYLVCNHVVSARMEQYAG